MCQMSCVPEIGWLAGLDTTTSALILLQAYVQYHWISICVPSHSLGTMKTWRTLFVEMLYILSVLSINMLQQK
ncbi:hypothetical protein BDR07DRAFT_489588 [Suillus spraguei]|nr:hypothetical protein BDR07DRAFT_489588 [Suillus spraguei]